ncbi:CLUMA_CG015832, isoform A [Clunio marinus]|uniref:Hepatocyte growth factor-regulated tyrosine kinase substrate n=1 Tax=Clunio marinus TaxID=568069 RepID=A0A1J1IQP1_9DIPT|nr:CLUMA_CG015832, isoform A [Clunio marinus]
MFKSSPFDKTLETATSHLKLEPDWASIMVICDLIRQNDITPKYAILQIKKKMFSTNPHTALYALMVLESVVKNCGSPIHEEISNKSNCETYTQLVQQTTHENVRNKMLELIQTWSFAFRTAHKYRGIKDTMNILKTEGYKFPEMKDVSDKLFVSDVAPEWAEGDVCHRCRVSFSLVQRKHHCRNCGQVFCGQCSSKTSTLPKFGIEKEVRVCDGCYDQLQRPSTSSIMPSLKKEEEELPAEYLASPLAQQSQQPVRKTEEELREEEELQLALALSQSEAESKKQQTFVRTYPKSPSPEMRLSPTPVEPETPSDPELARYLNRGYWENRQINENPASPSAPSPMASSIILNIQKSSNDQDIEIDDFTSTMRTQVEIFVNRMKSNSSRGRSIANDTSVQTLFMNITSMHSRLLTYIKEMDDKRLWYEQLQDKLSQVKDSRAALDVLRQEHLEKLRRIAEEQERQRQMQMAYKLEIMRKKKQEYLQYQRQLALQRIQEQEREMQIRQEQQKAQYMMGANNYAPYMSPPSTGSPMHGSMQFGQFPVYPGNPQMTQGSYGQMPMSGQGIFPNQHQQPNPQSAFIPINPAHNTMHAGAGGVPTLMSNAPSAINQQQQQTLGATGANNHMMAQHGPQIPMMQHQVPMQQQQQQQIPVTSTTAPPPIMTQPQTNPNVHQPQLGQMPQNQIYQSVQPPVTQQITQSGPPVAPQVPTEAEPEKPKEVETAELISFD